MRPLRRLLGVVVRIEDGLLTVLGLGLLAAAAAQLVFRLIGSGPLWLDPLMRTATLWLALVGALVATRERRQLHIDVIARRLRGWPSHLARGVVALFTTMICALLAQASWTLLLLERESGMELINGVPNWIALAILPIAFGLMALHALAYLLPPRADSNKHAR